ncbi:MAG: ABC transporter permease [Clostridia bacterium]|nr:ABC transporter permease [Clostridia bacterium]
MLLLFFALIFAGSRFLKSDVALPVVVLVDEDRSVEVRTFVENIAYNKLANVVAFEEMWLEEGLMLLDEGDAIGVIHIPKDTRNNLDTFLPSELILYLNDGDDIRAQFLRGYMADMVGLLNEGQSGAMVLWREVTRQQMSYEDKIGLLEAISFDYALAFLTRGDVFAANDVEDPFEGIETLQFFGYGLLWAALFLGAGFAHATVVSDLRSGMMVRLQLSGVTSRDYLQARLIVGSLWSMLCMSVVGILFALILKINLLPPSIPALIVMIGIVVLLNGYVILILMQYQSKTFLSLALLVVSATIYSSGILIPEFYLSSMMRWIGQFNIVNFGDNILKGYPVFTVRLGLLLLHAWMIWVLYRYLEAGYEAGEKAVKA